MNRYIEKRAVLTLTSSPTKSMQLNEYNWAKTIQIHYITLLKRN
jgi:hypothetical protein